MPYRDCGDGSREIQLPQRHRIKGFAAVVEKGNGGKMPYRGCREGTWGKRGRCRTGAVERVHGESGFRNGTESRVLLPLWKGGTEGRCRTGAVERVHGESGLRNGTETWILLPLWKRGWIMWPGRGGQMIFVTFGA